MDTPQFPDVIRIEPSGACNLRCIHCPTGMAQHNGGIMSKETFGIIMYNIKDKVPRVVVMYHGGEPLLCRDIWDWVVGLKSLGVGSIKTITNGTILNDSEIRKLANSGLDEVAISIDGESLEESDWIRRGSNCREIIANVKRLLEFKREINSVTPRVNISNVRLCDHCNLEKPEPPRFLLETFRDYKVGFECVYALRWAGGEEMKGCANHPPQVKGGYCPLLYETITIRWNGDVVPCCYDILGQCVLGNIHESGLDDIWGGVLYERVREGLRDGNPVEICKGCYGGY